MRPALFALAAALAIGSAAPSFADTMQRDGGHSGRLGVRDVVNPLPYGQVYSNSDLNSFQALRAAPYAARWQSSPWPLPEGSVPGRHAAKD